MDWIELAHDKDRRQEIVNVVLSIRVPQNAINFLLAEN
jgi:hypothetical protein